jgi:hypothetical protein
VVEGSEEQDGRSRSGLLNVMPPKADAESATVDAAPLHVPAAPEVVVKQISATPEATVKHESTAPEITVKHHSVAPEITVKHHSVAPEITVKHHSTTPEITVQNLSVPRDVNRERPNTASGATVQFSESLHVSLDSRRLSSQSTRPSGSDLFGAPLDFSFLDKPKIKLGPRPTADKRHSSLRASTEIRAVAALPAGLRATRAGPSSRPQSRDSTMTIGAIRSIGRLPPPPPIPESPTFPLQRPKSSSGSVKSLPASLPKSSGMTKERQRLLKFREMYKKKEKSVKTKNAPVPAAPIPEEQPRAEEIPLVNGVQVGDSSSPLKKADEEEKSAKGGADDVLDEARPAGLNIHTDDRLAPADDVATQVDESPASETSTAIHVGRAEVSAAEEPAVEVCADREPVANEPQPDLKDSADLIVEADPALDDSQKAETPSTEGHALQDTYSPTSVIESGQTSTRPTSVSENSVVPASAGEKSPKIDSSEEEATVVLGPERNAEISLPVETSQSTLVPAATEPAFAAESPRPETLSPPISREASYNDARIGTPLTQLSSDLPTGAVAEPPSADLNTSASSIEIDDDLIDELHAAKVQEAKPVSVSKSPIASFFQRRSNIGAFRAFSAPPKPDTSISDKPPVATVGSPPGRLRSASSNSVSPTVPRSAGDSPVVKKRVEGGIAAKIADLQRSFSKGSPADAKPFVPSGKGSAHKSIPLRVNTGSPSTYTPPKRMSSLFGSKRVVTPPAEPQRQTPSPPRSVPTNFYNQNVPKTPGGGSAAVTPKSESMSVRTTIVHKEKAPMADSVVTLESRESPRLRQSEFHSSPQLTTHHQRANSATSFRRASFHPVRSASVSSFRSTPNSPNLEQGAQRGDVFGFARRSIDGGWRSFGTRRKSESRVAPPPAPSSAMSSPLIPRNLSTTSLDTAASGESWGKERGGAVGALLPAAGEKKPSRTSRLLKRMSSSISSITHGSRVQLQTLSERVAHEEEAERPRTQRPKAVAVGDLNVQFPDTLVCS